MCPLCSSMRATPLKIITTARRSVHTLMGSKEAFRTRTRAFMIEADITRVRRKVSKFGVGSPAVREGSVFAALVLRRAKLICRLYQRAQISRLRNRVTCVRRDVQFRFRPGAMQVPGAL